MNFEFFVGNLTLQLPIVQINFYNRKLTEIRIFSAQLCLFLSLQCNISTIHKHDACSLSEKVKTYAHDLQMFRLLSPLTRYLLRTRDNIFEQTVVYNTWTWDTNNERTMNSFRDLEKTISDRKCWQLWKEEYPMSTRQRDTKYSQISDVFEKLVEIACSR